jgi:hypothetical protein
MTINFNVAPYYDDYSDDEGYLRVLFRPGFAVQARELTQLQTILQRQITRFGDHVFKNGSQVVPGAVNHDALIHFAKLDTLFINQTVSSYIDEFRNKIITGQTSGVKALVIDTSECECVDERQDVPTLYFKIEQASPDDVTKRFIPGETLVALASDNTVQNNYRLTENQQADIFVNIRSFGDGGTIATTFTGNENTDVLGYAFAAEVKEGIYYIDGFFVRNEEMHLYVGRFTNTPSFRVGFRVTEELITPEEEPRLSDNAQGTTNFAAPGAHRYRIKLSLVKLPLDSTDEMKFIELMRVKDGRVQNVIQKSSYAELEKTFARRTFDESGNYEVIKFKLASREHLNEDGTGVFPPVPLTGNIIANQTYGDPDKFVLSVDPGKAYIQGFEIEATSTQYIDFDKARENRITGEENGHIVREDDYPIQTPVGNYLLVNNVFNYPNLANFPLVNLYSVSRKPPNGNVITDGAAPPIETKVGTARVKSFQLHSGTYDGDNSQFRLGLFDVQMDRDPSTFAFFTFEKDVKSVALASGSSNIFTADIVGTPQLISGSVSVADSSDAVTGVGTLFTEQLEVGDILFIDGVAVGVVATIPNNVSLTLENAVGANDGRSGLVSVYRAVIRESRFNALVFKSAFETLKTLRGVDEAGNDTLKSSQHTVRRIVTSTASSEGGGVVWAFTLSSPSEFFQSVQDLSNYTLYDSTTNTIVQITSANLSLDSTQKQITISGAGLVAGRQYDLITSVLQTGVPAGEKTKSLAINQQQVVLGRKNVSEPQILLTHADVLRIKDIRVNPGNYDSFVELNSVSVLDKYEFDDGQRETHYQQARIILKPNVAPPAGALRITYDYFNHTGTGNYFSVDSYAAAIANPANNFGYEDIPSFPVKNSDGITQTVFLHDVIDYRPVISGANTFSPELPKIGEDFNTSLAYYLPRWDKLVLDSVGRFNVIRGIPARDPVEPRDPVEGMVLASVYIPAYTKTANDVRVFQRDNRRYTMKDIASLERRIQNLEYYVSLTLLETETEAFSIKDRVTGLDRFKNGFIVDQFTGHGIGDVSNVDYRIAVDPVRKQLRPMHFTDAVDIVEDIISADQRFSASYRKEGDLILLPYAEELSIFNPYGTRTIDVNPYKIGAFKGNIILNPEGDNWKDTDRRPDLLVQDDNNFDAIRFMAEQLGVTGTQWNAWQTQWTGTTSTTAPAFWSGNALLQRTTRVDTGVQSRDGIQTSLQSTINQQDYGDRVVDISFAEFMRSRPIVFIAQNLKPSARFYPFFDNESVSNYCQPADVFKVTRASGATFMRFDAAEVQDRVVATDVTRTYDGEIQPAFAIGDVLQNDIHNATVIQSINNITDPNGAVQFTVTVLSATGIRVGHHVQLSNMAPDRIVTTRTVVVDGRNTTQTTIRNVTVPTSREINNTIFRVSAVSGNTVTLTSLDGSRIRPFSSYDRAGAYAGADGGRLRRLRASCVVVYAGVIDNEDSNGPIVQDIHVVNVKNGFSIGESLVGSLVFENSARNQVVLTALNGNSTLGALPVMRQFSNAIRTDSTGSVAGLFILPNDDTLRFRTGERPFKLTDSLSNSDADFDSKGEKLYYSTGVTLSRERTVVNSRQANFVQDRVFESIPVRRVTTSTRVLAVIGGHDPLAQTFTVQSEGGMFLTSVDLYFSETGNRPVTVEIRTTNNGVPSSKILPFSEITKPISSILTSDDGSVATNFKFKSPVYLVDNETYALVVKTDEPGCQMFISELGKTDIVTGNIVSQQPLTGSLYLSQNSKEFEINPLLDMKFRMYQAQFVTNTTGQVQLKSTPPSRYKLPDNPFEITPGTDIIRVNAPRHGFSAGDIAFIDDVELFIEGTLQEVKHYGTRSQTFGIPGYLFLGGVTVLPQGLDQDSFCFKLDVTDNYINPQTGESEPNILITGETGNETTVQEILNQFVKGEYGGSGITCSRQLLIDTLFLKTDNIVPSETTLRFDVQAIAADGTPTPYQAVTENSNFSFGARKVIRSYENEEVLSAATGLVRPSLAIRARMTTSNPNVSPVIDLQRLSVFAIRNLINNPTEELTNIVGIDDRTLLSSADVTASAIDQEPGTGFIAAFHLTNVFGPNRVLPSSGVSGSKRTYSIPASSNFLFDGTGPSQTSEPWRRLRVGDQLVKTNGVDVIGTVESIAIVSTLQVMTLTNNTGAATTDGEQFLVRSRFVQGDGTQFTTQTPPTTLLFNTSGQFIGRVLRVTGTVDGNVLGNTLLELESLAQAATITSNVAPRTTYTIAGTEAKLRIENINGKGVISSNIDNADNLLELANAGKHAFLEGFISGVNGKYLIESVITEQDTSINVGNPEKDKTSVIFGRPFTILGPEGVYRVDMVNDYLYFRGSGQLTSSSSATRVVNGNGDCKFTQEVSVGDVITLQSFGGDEFEGTAGIALGVVAEVNSDTQLTLVNNSTFSVISTSNFFIRKRVPNFRVAQLDKFVEDWAPVGTSNYANYITRPIILSNPADSLKILFDSNIPAFTSLRVYYKVWSGSTDPNTVNFVDTGFTSPAIDPQDSFNEQSIDVLDTTPFTRAIIKIVFKSNDPSKVPLVKSLRLIAHS